MKLLDANLNQEYFISDISNINNSKQNLMHLRSLGFVKETPIKILCKCNGLIKVRLFKDSTLCLNSYLLEDVEIVQNFKDLEKC